MFKNKINVSPSSFVDDFNGMLYIIRSLVNEVNTADIVKVVSVDGNNTLTVVPVVSSLNIYREGQEESEISGVKYIQWQFGDNLIEATPKKDDIGLMVICKKDISSIDSGIVASNRQYCPADGVYIGGLFGFNSEPKQSIKFDDTGITITSNKTVNVNATNVNVVSPLVNIGDAEGVLKPIARDGDIVKNSNNIIIGTIVSSSTNVNAT